MKQGDKNSLPEGWEMKKLGEVCDFENGDRGSNYPSKAHRTTTGIPFINAGHLTSKGLDLICMDYISRERYDLLGNGKIRKGDILFCLRGSLGKYAKVEEFTEGAIASSLVIVRPKQIVNTDFIMVYFACQICEDMISYHSNGAAQPNLSAASLKRFEIPIPPLEEQQRIVAKLDEAFEAIEKAKANAEQNLKNARELFESYLQAILSDKKWPIKALGEICEKVEYGSSSKSKEQGAIAVLRMGNIKNGRFSWDKLVYSDDDEENKKYLLKYNDVLFNRTNSPELVGKTAIYKGEMPAIFAGYLIRIHRKEQLLDADYLNYYLNSNIANDYGKTVVISSVNQANINGAKLKGYPVPLPSLSEQQSIVQKLDALSAKTKKLEAIYQKKLEDLEELKKSILQKAFSGKF